MSETTVESPEHPLLRCIVQVRGNGNGNVAVVAARGRTPAEIQSLFTQLANSDHDPSTGAAHADTHYQVVSSW